MSTTAPYSGRERHHAESLYVCSGLTLAKIEQTTGIHLNTLSRWAKAEDWTQRRETYRALALTVPEIMQAHALKMQAWAEEEKEKATTPRELNASVESGNKAMYALYLADQAYRAHPYRHRDRLEQTSMTLGLAEGSKRGFLWITTSEKIAKTMKSP